MGCQLIVLLKKRKILSQSKAKILSPAKINLYLNILGKYPSGYYQLESIAERISLFDEITISPTENNSVRIFCNLKSLQNSDNLCVKAAKLLKQKYRLKTGFDINLKKTIPVGSGLGGGSSNAATTLIAINELCSLNLGQEELYALGKSIGSDVNFFLSQSSFALMEGRGEKVKPFKGFGLSHVIIWPKVNLATKMVYAAQRAKLTKFLNNVKILQYALKKGDIELVRNNIFNALEKPALSLCRQLSQAQEELSRESIFAKVTGSGSALYTVASGLKADRLKKILPGDWFIREARTF